MGLMGCSNWDETHGSSTDPELHVNPAGKNEVNNSCWEQLGTRAGCQPGPDGEPDLTAPLISVSPALPQRTARRADGRAGERESREPQTRRQG